MYSHHRSSGREGGPEGGPDGGPEGGPDGGPEGGPDGGPEGGPEGGPDGGPEGGPEGGPDGGPEGGPEGGPDGGPEGGPDGGPVDGVLAGGGVLCDSTGRGGGVDGRGGGVAAVTGSTGVGSTGVVQQQLVQQSRVLLQVASHWQNLFSQHGEEGHPRVPDFQRERALWISFVAKVELVAHLYFLKLQFWSRQVKSSSNHRMHSRHCMKSKQRMMGR